MSVSRYAVAVCVGLAWSFQASAAITQISNVNITGGYDVWSDVADNNVLVNIGDTNTGTATLPLNQYLTGSASAPGDNIELGNDRSFSDWSNGLNSTTLTGDIGSGLSVELITPSLSDWSDDSTTPSSLAYAYVTAALASLGKTPGNWDPDADDPTDPTSFDEAVAEFVFGDGTIPISGAFVLSDPNISYLYAKHPDPRSIYIGLAGNLDAQFLNPLLPFVGITPGSVQVQASEVVLLNVIQSGNTVYSAYKYGFYATPTGQGAEDCYNGTGEPLPTCSYTGNYEVPVPAPAALLALGLMGLMGSTFTRRPRV